MNKETSNKHITCTQDINRSLSYKFVFMDDDNTYSVSFDGQLPEGGTKKLLEAVKNCLYENMADGIQLYLKQHNLEYSDFIARRQPLEHHEAMKFAELFLHTDTCDSLGIYIGNTDVCYIITDHQQPVGKNNCEGCYIAAKIVSALHKRQYQYNIIGQNFIYDWTSGDEHGSFAIRTNKNSRYFYNLDESENRLIFPAFGCVDITGLLLDIDSIQTIERAEKIAVR